MKTFMVNIKFSRINEEFASLIPAHRKQVDRLMADGVITDYALAADRSRIWAVINAETEGDVFDALAQLPLRKYMLPEVHELMFHNKAFVQFPAFSLN